MNGFGALGWGGLWLGLSDMVLTEERLDEEEEEEEEDRRWLLQFTPLLRPGEDGV